MFETMSIAAFAAIFLGLVAAAYVLIRYRHLFGIFSKRSHHINIGPLTFRLNYIYALRNPSGKMIFIWTDELGRTYEQVDPRVLVIETIGSVWSRQLRSESDPIMGRYADAVKKHVGHGKGWISVTKTEPYRYPIFRTIAFCIVHLTIEPAPKHEAIED